jgi:hypothetical protein
MFKMQIVKKITFSKYHFNLYKKLYISKSCVIPNFLTIFHIFLGIIFYMQMLLFIIVFLDKKVIYLNNLLNQDKEIIRFVRKRKTQMSTTVVNRKAKEKKNRTMQVDHLICR